MGLLPVAVGDKPKQAKSSWVEYSQQTRFSAGCVRQSIRQKATPKQISHMEYWLDAVADLGEKNRRIVLARACRIS